MMTLVTKNPVAKVEMVSRQRSQTTEKNVFKFVRGFGTSITIKAYRPTTEEEIFFQVREIIVGDGASKKYTTPSNHLYKAWNTTTTTQLSKRQIMAWRRKVLGRIQWNFKPRWSCRNARFGVFIKRKICGRVQFV